MSEVGSFREFGESSFLGGHVTDDPFREYQSVKLASTVPSTCSATTRQIFQG